MRKYFLYTIMLLLSYHLQGQDMSGEWNGMLQQEEGGIAQTYYFSMQLTQEGQKIKGVSRISLTDRPNIYGIMELDGVFKNEQLKFRETKVKQQFAPNIIWCLKRGQLKFTIKKDGFCIEGTWAGEMPDGSNCYPGKLTLCKIVPIAKR